MGIKFDKWSLLKIFEVAFAVACLITKRVTDDEAARLFLYLQKLSREWSLLNNVTWDRIGSAVADATYGGYVIITAALLIGRLIGELPTEKRVTEMILLGIGALLFVILGSLEFAALDSVPPDLIDNAAILGTLSLTTAALFLLDLAGPKAKKAPTLTQTPPKNITRALEIHKMKSTREPFNLEPEFTRIEHARIENERNGKLNEGLETAKMAQKNGKSGHKNGTKNGMNGSGVHNGQNGYKKMGSKEKTFDIYGKDGSETDDLDETGHQKMEQHSPVWSKIQKGHYGKYDIVAPHFLYPAKKEMDEVDDDRPPSSPGDPGYVQYMSKRWGKDPEGKGQKTPRHSPTQV